jgi:hypothetical protein
MSAIIDLVLLIVFAIVNYGLVVFPYKFMMNNFGWTGVLVYYGVFALVFGKLLLGFDFIMILMGMVGKERLA